MEEKVLIKSKGGVSIISAIVCFVIAVVSVLVFFIVAPAVEGSLERAFENFEYGWWANFAGAGLFLCIGLILLCFSKREITITSKFVYIKTLFYITAMPIKKITCVKKGCLRTIIVVTASSRVQCVLVDKVEQVYDSIIDLINEK